MMDNQILSDVIEHLVVEDSVTGERIAVITHEDVFTASDNIVVRLKPRTALFKKFCKRDFCDEVRDFKIPEPEAVAS